MSLKYFIKILLSAVLMLQLLKKYESSLSIPFSTIVEYKQVHNLLYDSIGDMVNATTETIQFNKDSSLGRDLISFFHPDLILEDQYISLHHNTYDSHKQWANIDSFVTDYHYPITSRIRYNQFLFNPYAISKENNAHQKYPSIYEKYYRVPLNPDLNMKSFLAYGQIIFTKNQELKMLHKLALKNLLSQKGLYRINIYIRKIRLSRKDQCLEVMDILRTKSYMIGDLPLKYLVKTDLHRQLGVFFLDEEKLNQILYKYDNGTKCGEIKDDWTFQEFIFNPIFYQDRAFTFRIYVLFVSTKPWITYIYTRSMFQVCMRPWSEDELYSTRHLCNPTDARKYWGCIENQNNETCQHHMDAAHFHEMIPAPWFTNMTDYLIDQNYVKDKSWTETYFYPTITQKLGYLFNEATTMPEDSRLCALYGLDFEIDQDLDIWLLDFNVYPSLAVTIDDRQNMLTQFYDDTVALILQHLRSKYLRLKDLIQNKLLPHVQNKLKLSQKQIEEAIDIAMTDVDDDVKVGQYHHNYYKMNLKDFKKDC